MLTEYSSGTGKILSLVDLLGGKVQTKKKMHKTVYLLQQKGEDFGYRFIFHSFGVFSPGLAADLDKAAEDQLLKIDKGNADGRVEYSISLAAGDSTEQEARECISKDQIALAKKLGGQEPRLLEALSTVVYLHKNYYSGNDLKAKLEELKPKLTTYFDDAFKMASSDFGVTV